ncbi:hypothetical protein JL107_16100 [Nakamurella flavida]|uniref:ANTAR domain-containing protein n=1 Tax=Nakamurella flavida TaxID=363630 RepID=A0A938YR86_9ACTN|nr:hypothetical protein [Nakamurella flavida]MBM9477972.1 hypothetical protein [Nakamurella flavida]MDP9778312.1 hypothetical protein [Nakamurella flavida]
MSAADTDPAGRLVAGVTRCGRRGRAVGILMALTGASAAAAATDLRRRADRAGVEVDEFVGQLLDGPDTPRALGRPAP